MTSLRDVALSIVVMGLATVSVHACSCGSAPFAQDQFCAEGNFVANIQVKSGYLVETPYGSEKSTKTKITPENKDQLLRIDYNDQYMYGFGFFPSSTRKTIEYHVKILKKYRGPEGINVDDHVITSEAFDYCGGPTLEIGSEWFVLEHSADNFGFCGLLLPISRVSPMMEKQMTETWPKACGKCSFCSSTWYRSCSPTDTCEHGEWANQFYFLFESEGFSCLPSSRGDGCTIVNEHEMIPQEVVAEPPPVHMIEEPVEEESTDPSSDEIPPPPPMLIEEDSSSSEIITPTDADEDSSE